MPSEGACLPGNQRASRPGCRGRGGTARQKGARGGIRTPDLCLRRATLYPAELRARATVDPLAYHSRRTDKGIDWSVEQWSGRLDLNQRPPAPEAGALPGYATPRR